MSDCFPDMVAASMLRSSYRLFTLIAAHSSECKMGSPILLITGYALIGTN